MKSFWEAIKKFIREFLSGNNEVVHSPTVIMAFIGLCLAAPIVAFSLDALYFHIFTLRKGLDGPSVNLLLGLLGTATGGLGIAAFFSRTTMSQFTSIGGIGEAVPGPPAGKAKPAA